MAEEEIKVSMRLPSVSVGESDGTEFGSTINAGTNISEIKSLTETNEFVAFIDNFTDEAAEYMSTKQSDFIPALRDFSDEIGLHSAEPGDIGLSSVQDITEDAYHISTEILSDMYAFEKTVDAKLNIEKYIDGMEQYKLKDYIKQEYSLPSSGREIVEPEEEQEEGLYPSPIIYKAGASPTSLKMEIAPLPKKNSKWLNIIAGLKLEVLPVELSTLIEAATVEALKIHPSEVVDIWKDAGIVIPWDDESWGVKQQDGSLPIKIVTAMLDAKKGEDPTLDSEGNKIVEVTVVNPDTGESVTSIPPVDNRPYVTVDKINKMLDIWDIDKDMPEVNEIISEKVEDSYALDRLKTISVPRGIVSKNFELYDMTLSHVRNLVQLWWDFNDTEWKEPDIAAVLEQKLETINNEYDLLLETNIKLKNDLYLSGVQDNINNALNYIKKHISINNTWTIPSDISAAVRSIIQYKVELLQTMYNKNNGAIMEITKNIVRYIKETAGHRIFPSAFATRGELKPDGSIKKGSITTEGDIINFIEAHSYFIYKNSKMYFHKKSGEETEVLIGDTPDEGISLSLDGANNRIRVTHTISETRYEVDIVDATLPVIRFSDVIMKALVAKAVAVPDVIDETYHTLICEKINDYFGEHCNDTKASDGKTWHYIVYRNNSKYNFKLAKMGDAGVEHAYFNLGAVTSLKDVSHIDINLGTNKLCSATDKLVADGHVLTQSYEPIKCKLVEEDSVATNSLDAIGEYIVPSHNSICSIYPVIKDGRVGV
jgi:hypothetical protein